MSRSRQAGAASGDAEKGDPQGLGGSSRSRSPSVREDRWAQAHARDLQAVKLGIPARAGRGTRVLGQRAFPVRGPRAGRQAGGRAPGQRQMQAGVPVVLRPRPVSGCGAAGDRGRGRPVGEERHSRALQGDPYSCAWAGPADPAASQAGRGSPCLEPQRRPAPSPTRAGGPTWRSAHGVNQSRLSAAPGPGCARGTDALEGR